MGPESKPESLGRVNKLIVGFDSGRIRYLDGKEAESFVAQIDGAAFWEQMRGPEELMIPEPNWKYISPEEVSKLFEKTTP